MNRYRPHKEAILQLQERVCVLFDRYSALSQIKCALLQLQANTVILSQYTEAPLSHSTASKSYLNSCVPVLEMRYGTWVVNMTHHTESVLGKFAFLKKIG